MFLEIHVAYIFSIEEYTKQETSMKLVARRAYSSEMLVDFQWTTRRYIPEDRTFHNHHCENLKT
jgi:hypothetical protein